MRKAPVFVFVLLSLSLLLFQNCTQPTIPEDTASTFSDKLAFAYDAKLNQIAYMSCSTMAGTTYDKSAYYTLRAGAYDNNAALGLTKDNGGLRVTPAYMTSVQNRLAADQWGLLSQSAANTGTIAQLSIRHLNDLQNIETAAGGSGIADSDYMNMFQELGPSGVSIALVGLQPTKRLKYLTDGTVQGSRLEGSLYFMDSETLASSVRNNLNGDTYALGLTYTDMTATSTSNIAARSSATTPLPTPTNANPNRDIYGRGFHIRFAKLAGSDTAYPVNLMDSITEQDFHTTTDREGQWNCSSLRFKIVRAEDAPAQNCQSQPDPANAPALLKIARNSLRYEDWFIDMNHMCIVPKKNSSGCYGPNAYVQYDTTLGCTPNPTTNNPQIDTNMACAAYASICFRVN